MSFDAVIDVGKLGVRHGLIDRIGERFWRRVYVGGFVAQDFGDLADAVGDDGPAGLGVGEGFAGAAREVEKGGADREEQHVRVAKATPEFFTDGKAATLR